jgi:hypothetical protein
VLAPVHATSEMLPSGFLVIVAVEFALYPEIVSLTVALTVLSEPSEFLDPTLTLAVTLGGGPSLLA